MNLNVFFINVDPQVCVYLVQSLSDPPYMQHAAPVSEKDISKVDNFCLATLLALHFMQSLRMWTKSCFCDKTDTCTVTQFQFYKKTYLLLSIYSFDLPTVHCTERSDSSNQIVAG